MPLPNPGMSFDPFDTLPASDLNDMVENIEALADGSGLDDESIPYTALKPGMVVQVVETDSSANTSGSNILPTDGTIPQNTEGFEVMTQAITPKEAGNTLIVEAHISLGASSGTTSLAAALFQDSTANALTANGVFQATSAGDTLLYLRCKVTAASTSATTFKVRIGSENGGKTITFGNGRWGGIPHSSIKVTEVKG